VQKGLFSALLQLADDHLVLGHRLSEWCGHAPMLEEDLALPNIALDLIGQARSLYTYAGEIEGVGRDEDALAFCRIEREYQNLLICELPNGDFAQTILRQFYFSSFMLLFWEQAQNSSDGSRPKTQVMIPWLQWLEKLLKKLNTIGAIAGSG